MAVDNKVKVALIQNRLQPGGRFQVMAAMIKVLNDNGVVPDVWGFRSKLNNRGQLKYYGKELRFHWRKLKGEWPMPFEWNIVWFNWKVSPFLEGYDLVINHNNTSLGLRTSTPLLSYVHFPRKARLRSNLGSIHLSENGPPGLLNLKKDALNIMRLVYRKDNMARSNEKIIANSEFCKQALLKQYTYLTSSDVDVLYPPIKVPDSLPNSLKDSALVLSLGRFDATKRQLEQIRIAEQLPELRFKIMGFKGDGQYFDRCQDLVKDKGLQNVELVADATARDRENAIQSAGFFLHNVRNEPFGISSAQAISGACIPLVHNSGGQKEVVPFPELRFREEEEAVIRIRELLQLPESQLHRYKSKLFAHIQEYSAETFEFRFQEKVSNLLHAHN